MSIWLLYILLEVVTQWWLITYKKWKPIYINLFLLRGMASIFHALLLELMGAIELNSMRDYLPVLLFQTTSFWILFDLGLNLLRGKKWYYKGKNSGWLDSLPPSIYYTLKIIAVCTLLML
jgi:hypothetical protein